MRLSYELPNKAAKTWLHISDIPLNEKWSFPLRISSVNVTRSAGVTLTEEILNVKLHFLCSVPAMLEQYALIILPLSLKELAKTHEEDLINNLKIPLNTIYGFAFSITIKRGKRTGTVSSSASKKSCHELFFLSTR